MSLWCVCVGRGPFSLSLKDTLPALIILKNVLSPLSDPEKEKKGALLIHSRLQCWCSCLLPYHRHSSGSHCTAARFKATCVTAGSLNQPHRPPTETPCTRRLDCLNPETFLDLVPFFGIFRLLNDFSTT